MEQKNQSYKLFSVTTIIIALNVLVFIVMSICDFAGLEGFTYESGAMYWPYLTEYHEYYRLITHMFMHAGFEHLLSNMFMLFFLGSLVEDYMGRPKYIITYFASGIFAGLFSGFAESLTNDFSLSVGASGAIYGILGAFIVIIIKNQRIRKGTTFKRLFLILILMIIGGIQPGIDWMAHLGGAICGITCAVLMYRRT